MATVSISDHFDGRRFHNLGDSEPRSFSDFLHWTVDRKPGSWQKWIDAPPGPSPPSRVEGGGLRVTFVNHSTVLVQTEGVNLLTDPVWSDRIGPVSWVGPRRHRSVGLPFEDLPPIDVVLLSHDHYDHFDVPTLTRLIAKWNPEVVVPLGVRERLARLGLPSANGNGATRGHAFELDWWRSAGLPGGLKVTAVPARHFSGRGLRDRNSTLWCGYVVEGPSGNFYFAGDTGFGGHFDDIAECFPALRLALLPIGAYRPHWFMSPVHMSPHEAVEAHRVLRAGSSVAIHFGTFRLADDGQHEPVEDLSRAVAALHPAPRFWALGFGEGRDVP